MDKVLIVGSGSVAGKHLSLVSSHFPEAVIASWKRKPSGGSNQLELFSESEIIQFQPSISIVASPTIFHFSQASFLMNLGSHVLLEKPIGLSAHGVQGLYENAKERKVIFQVAYNLRFSKSLTFFEELINSNRLGDSQSVTIEVDQYLPAWRPSINYRHSVSAQKALGGGALLELSHEIDYALRLFGPLEIEYSKLARASNLDIDVEDYVDVIGTFSADTKTPVQARIHLAMVNRASRRFCEVIGSETSARWDGLSGTVEIFDSLANTWEKTFSIPSDIESSYERQLLHFLKSVNAGYSDSEMTKSLNHELEVITTLDSIRSQAATANLDGGIK